jgi:hypothetical protein
MKALIAEITCSKLLHDMVFRLVFSSKHNFPLVIPVFRGSGVDEHLIWTEESVRFLQLSELLYRSHAPQGHPIDQPHAWAMLQWIIDGHGGLDSEELVRVTITTI